MIKSQPSAGLGKAGSALWTEMTKQRADDGLALDARERRWLRDACAESDQLARIEAVLAKGDLEVIGSTGQPRAHPMLAEATRCRHAIGALLARLALSDPITGSTRKPGSGSRTTSTSGRRAALARHHGTDGLGG